MEKAGGLLQSWREAWGIRAYRQQCIWSVPVLLALLVLVRVFAGYAIEPRSAVVLGDPLVALLPALDLSWIIHVLLYSSLLLGLATLVPRPFGFLLFVRSAAVMILFRFVTLFVLPLDPPQGFIPLIDPLLPLPFTGHALTKDLFFSWQAAIPALFLFTARTKDLRFIFAALTVLLSLLLLLQHAQYTISVIAAPCFALTALALARPWTAGPVRR